MYPPSARAVPLLALALSGPAWACPERATLTCGTQHSVTEIPWYASSYDGQCADTLNTWDGGDFTVELSVPAGRRFYVDAFVSAWTCSNPSCNGQPPDLDLFLYDRDDCVDWTDQTCLDASATVDVSLEHVEEVSNGGLYQASVDEFWGPWGDYDDFDATVRLHCPTACNPAVATPISCSTDFVDQPVGTSDVLDYYACGDPFTHLAQYQPETVFSFTPQATGTVRFRLAGMTHDFDIYVLQGTCDQIACIESSTRASTSTDLAEFQAVAGTTYYIVVEAFDASSVAEGGTFDLSFDAGTAGCKEDCDNTSDDDGDGLTDCLDPDCCVDAVCADVSPLCCPDGDGDGFFPERCDGGDDCDDRPSAGFATNPDATEICNGLDDDCDGTTDEGTECFDDDGDGWTEQAGDCDDADPAERPGGVEVCDGSDDDCDEVIDEGTTCYDDDGDCACEAAPCAGSVRPSCPSLTGGDCRDGDDDVGPAVTEVPDNGVDDDCDGSVDGGIYDPDGDGITAAAGDCDDLDATAFPGATEAPDGADDDCDGVADEGTTAFDDDGDGACEGAQLDADANLECSDGAVPGDCGDFDPGIGPASPEIDGNGVDDDCDGSVDEGGDAFDDDGDGLSEDEGDCDDARVEVHPAAEEVANDVDDDCDGEIDEGFRDVDGDGVTVEEGDCDDEDGWVRPGLLDVCDGLDNDCDGGVDEDCDEERTAPPASDVGGCGCATGGAPGWPALLALLALRRRRLAGVALLAGCANETDVSPLAAELSVTSDLIDLGDVAVGAEVPFAVEIVHERGAGAAVEAVDVFNMEGDAFAAGADRPEVPVGGSASVGLVYAPTEAGWHQAVVTVMTDADLSRELVVIVRGHAVNTSVSLWPRIVDFGPVEPGEVATETVTLSNTGLVDVAVVSSSLVHPRFDVVTSLPVTVPAGGTVTVEVAFAPADGASATDALALALDHASVPVVEMFGNACEVGLPALYDADLDGWTSCGGDCDDGDTTANPGATEAADGDDEDCDAEVDEGTDVWDDDGDCACEAPPCTGSSATCTLSAEPDCADADPAIGPAAAEVPDNGVDDDCDGVVDQGTTDLDGDGYAPEGADCDDQAATRYPGAPELPNGVDDDCDLTADEGTVKYDDDGDGRCEHAPCTVGALGGGDCDDRPTSGLTAYPGATETANGRDDDCDGEVDEDTPVSDDDGDGFSEQAGDCNDADPAAYPGTPACAT